jgi:pimeloyl-ACP methyl ester carboxylesterase
MVGPDLSDYSTVSAADDLDSIRSALGARTLDLLGRGAGATLAAVYADRYPGRIGAAVLDGPSDPSLAPGKQAQATAMADERSLVSFAAACGTFSGGCPLGADPAAAVASLVKSLGDTGVPSSDGQRINGGSVLLALTDELGQPAEWPTLATALASARDGDTDAVAAILRDRLGANDVEQQQAGRIVYACNDFAARLSEPALQAAANASRTGAPLFGPFLIGRVGVCGAWPAPENALGRVTATGAAPILVVGAVDDPVAPYSAVRSLTAGLDSATLLSWQSGTHGSYPASSCVTGIVDAYLLEGTMPAAGTLCPP